MTATIPVGWVSCDDLSRDPALRRTLLPVLRKFFTETKDLFADFDPLVDDVALLRYSLAKYHNRRFDDPELVANAEEVHRRLVCLYQVPDHACSWYNKAFGRQLS